MPRGKKNANSEQVKAAIKRILKNSQKYNEKPDTHGIFEQNGVFIAMDSFHAIMLSSDIEEFPHTEGPENFDIGHFIKKFVVDKWEKLSPPDMDTIKEYIKDAKADGIKGQIIYNLCDDVFVDAKYLLDMVQALPGCYFHRPQNATQPIYFVSQNGNDGILMPIKMKKKED